MSGVLNRTQSVLIVILLLIGFDVSLMFAAQKQTEQTQQLLNQPILNPSLNNKSQGKASKVTKPNLADRAKLSTKANPPKVPAEASATTSKPKQAPKSKAATAPQAVQKGEDPTTWLKTYQKEVTQAGQALASTNSNSPPDTLMKALNNEAFEMVARDAFPMNSDQIKTLRERLDETQRVAAALPGTPPKPVSTSLVVNLAPGATPPNIRLGRGFISSLVFLDASGAPWTIQSYDVGNPQDINVKFDKNIPNTLFLQSMRDYAYGNIAINLEGSKTPVMLTLIPGQNEIDYRVDVRVQSLSPNPNRDLLTDGMPAKANAVLLNLLNGVPPRNSRQLKVDGAYSQAWISDGRVWFRSRFKVISPSPLASMMSADGTLAYELPKTSMVLVSKHGKVVQMALSGGGQHG